jgi:hypothetical protein
MTRQPAAGCRLLACAIVAATVLLRAQATSPRFYVTPTGAALVTRGLAAAAPDGADAASFPDVATPLVRNAPSSGYAQATIAPWVESNGWRFQRGVRKARYSQLPRGSAVLAAAEAFTFQIDAILAPDPADVADLGSFLQFAKEHAQPAMPALADVGLVDDGSDTLAEALNMLTRRNLLYRLVHEPDRALALNVQIGTRDFPIELLRNPSDFAARVREKIGDEKRLVRLYGTNTTIARLTGTADERRLYLVNYGRNRVLQDVRVRVLGSWQPHAAAFRAAPEPIAFDVEHVGGATEFTLAKFDTLAIIDLKK